MRVILFLLAILAGLAGFLILVSAKGAVHEIEGFILWLIAAVLLTGAAIIDAIYSAIGKLKDEARADQGQHPVQSASTSEPPLAQPPAPAPEPAPVSGPFGTCPNCNAKIPLSVTECPKCKADFGPRSSWKIQPLRIT